MGDHFYIVRYVHGSTSFVCGTSFLRKHLALKYIRGVFEKYADCEAHLTEYNYSYSKLHDKGHWTIIPKILKNGRGSLRCKPAETYAKAGAL